MEPRSIQFLSDAAGGTLRGNGQGVVSRICTDSRQAGPGDLFVAIKGERFDGHDFLQEVIGKGVTGVVVENGRTPTDARQAAVLVVRDCREALGRMAACYRREFNLSAIVVAGSNGKTTTKEILASVLRVKLEATWSEASFNNDIGVPLSLFQIGAHHKAGVFEAGTNHPGELAPLVGMIAPQYSVITSLGREHLEHFGGLDGVVAEEGWAAELLPEDGKLFVNGDTPHLDAVVSRTKAATETIGTSEGCFWRVADVKPELRSTVFSLQTKNQTWSGSYRVPLLGLHQAVNATFAIAIGAQLGLSKEDIQSGLANCKPAKMRLQMWEAQGVRVLDDSYNANADSMIAALRTLGAFPCSGRRVAVLGDMAELGSHSEEAHLEVGRCAAELGVGQLFAVGSMAPQMARGARSAGLHRVLEFSAVDAAKAAVRSFVKPGDVVLVKASRVMRLEQISEALRGAESTRRN